MSDLVLRLPNYNNFSVTIPREQVLNLSSTGLLAQALEIDPTAPEIDITQPFITPEILTFLGAMITTQQIPKSIPDNSKNLALTGDYLGLPILEVIANPEYKVFKNHYPDLDLVRSKPLLNSELLYRQIMIYAIQHKYSELFDYLISITNLQSVDKEIISLSVIGDFVEGVREMLRERKIDPLTASEVSRETIRVYFPNADPILAYAFPISDIPTIFQYTLYANIEILNLLLPFIYQPSRGYFNVASIYGRYDIISHLIDVGKASRLDVETVLSSSFRAPREFIEKLLNLPRTKSKDIDDEIRHLLLVGLVPISTYNLKIYYEKLPQYNQFFRILVANPKTSQWARNLYTLSYYVATGNLDEVKKLFPSVFRPSSIANADLEIRIAPFLLVTTINYDQVDIFQYLLREILKYYPSFYNENWRDLREIAEYNKSRNILQGMTSRTMQIQS